MSDLIDREVGDDASLHLEEILGDAVAPRLETLPATAPASSVELVGPHLRIQGMMATGNFRRLSDFVNHHDGLFRIHDATVLRRNGDPTNVTMPDVWVAPLEVTLIAQRTLDPLSGETPEFTVPKRRDALIVVTPGHTITAEIYIPQDAQLSVFIESTDPRFVPMTNVRTRSLADRRVVARYPFALLNRRHIVAASPLPPELQGGRRVL
ncbi:MAG: hypothetical protein ACYC65_10035 [Candidatus Limnocylindrales bacterium]